jgi:hypothetical protein
MTAGRKVRSAGGIIGKVTAVHHTPSVVVELDSGLREVWPLDAVEVIRDAPPEPEGNLAIRWKNGEPWIRMVGERGPRWVGWHRDTQSWDSVAWDELPHPLTDVPDGAVRVTEGDQFRSGLYADVITALSAALRQLPDDADEASVVEACSRAVMDLLAAHARQDPAAGKGFPTLQASAPDNAVHDGTG